MSDEFSEIIEALRNLPVEATVPKELSDRFGRCERRFKNVALWRYRRSVENRSALGRPGWISSRITTFRVLIRHEVSEGLKGVHEYGAMG